MPAAQEPVVGTIALRLGEGYRVDIGAGQYASLDGLAFEGATRRSRPNLKVCMAHETFAFLVLTWNRSAPLFMPAFLLLTKIWIQN